MLALETLYLRRSSSLSCEVEHRHPEPLQVPDVDPLDCGAHDSRLCPILDAWGTQHVQQPQRIDIRSRRNHGDVLSNIRAFDIGGNERTSADRTSNGKRNVVRT